MADFRNVRFRVERAQANLAQSRSKKAGTTDDTAVALERVQSEAYPPLSLRNAAYEMESRLHVARSSLIIGLGGMGTARVNARGCCVVDQGMGDLPAELYTRKIKSKISAEALADQSIEACSPQETTTQSIIRKHYGNSQDQSFQKLKNDNRGRAIELINSDRSGTTVSDPTVAWGDCIGQHAKNGIHSSKTNDQVVDQAFQECRSFEAGVMQYLTRSSSAPQAANLMDQGRKTMRSQVLIMVADARKK